MKQRERHRLNNNWTYAQGVWPRKQKEYGLYNWTLRSKDMTSIAGLCVHNTKTIYLSSILMRGANCNYRKVRDVLLHEIAHALTPGHSHNQIWKKECAKIGGDTRLAVSMNLPGMNWSVYCRNCKWRQEHFNKPNITNRVCTICRYQPRVKYIK